MRILVISNFFPPYHIGGYELGCADVVAGLKTRGHEVRVLTSHHGIAEPTQSNGVYRWLRTDSLRPENAGSQHVAAIVKKELANRRAMKRVCASFRPDLVYVWNAAEWDYVQVGSTGDSADDQVYLEKVRLLAGGCGARVLADIARSELRVLYEQAKIFWHAAGLNEDEARPELSEHFGIATVEAMAAGCVPIVINRGAQPEIVEHGVSGFLWNSIDDLTDYTLLLASDDKLRAKMSAAARARAGAFSKDASVSRLSELLTR
jgi:glycosyltransferase involved in cell wall biosynthesis